MSIVVGTDFSAHAAEALEVAAALARRHGERLHLAHVVDPVALRAARSGEAPGALVPAEAQLAAERDRLRAGGAEVESELLTGSPDEALVELAERVDARLLVVAALGWRSGERWRLGGAAERLAQTTGCPLLLVRTAAPFLAWARGERPLKVVVGDDASRLATGALRWLEALRRVGPCEVTVAHVYVPYSEYRRLGLTSPGTGPADVEAILAAELRERAEALGAGRVRIRLAHSFGRAAEPLVALAEQERADLLVLGTHQRRLAGRLWHGSVSHVVLHLASMAVALVPPRPTPPVVRPIPEVRRVLVATDLSEFGNEAIPHALALLPRGGQLFLVHVVETPVPVVFPEAIPGYVPAPLVDAREEEQLRQQLQALVPPDTRERGVDVHVEVVAGESVPVALCQASERHLADVLCLSTHGRTGLLRRPMGSVASGVLERLCRPVLLVRPPGS